MSIFDLDPPAPQMISLSLPSQVWEKAFTEALTDALKRSEALRTWVEAQVVKTVKEMAADDPHLAEIRAEVQDYMRRYPAISDDEKLQEKVAMTIFNHIQGGVR